MSTKDKMSVKLETSGGDKGNKSSDTKKKVRIALTKTGMSSKAGAKASNWMRILSVIAQAWSSFTLKGATEGALKMGLFKLSLMASLPVVILVSLATDRTLQNEQILNTVQDLIQKQTAGPPPPVGPHPDPKPGCYAYNPQKFHAEDSILTYFPNGRLGNMISAYLMLSWVQLDHKLPTYLERQAVDTLSQYFVYANQTHSILEEDLCDWRQFGWRKYEGNVEDLGQPDYRTGHAIQIFMDRGNFMRQEVQGGRKYYTNYRKESNILLTMHDKFARYADINLNNIAKKVGVPSDEITFVGIHNRRTDYLDFRRRVLGLSNLYEDYFTDATDYFVEEYGDDTTVVFVYISDDMKWGRRNLKSIKNVFFLGCGNGDTVDCIGKDLAVLGACNHTIVTHGSFGHWAAFMAGGEVYTEYGTIVPGIGA